MTLAELHKWYENTTKKCWILSTRPISKGLENWHHTIYANEGKMNKHILRSIRFGYEYKKTEIEMPTLLMVDYSKIEKNPF